MMATMMMMALMMMMMMMMMREKLGSEGIAGRALIEVRIFFGLDAMSLGQKLQTLNKMET
jgi:hypothetical protein